MPKPDPIAEQMRAVRVDRGLSLPGAEALTGVKAVVIGSWERGDRQPSLAKLRQWVEAFGLELAVVDPGQLDGATRCRVCGCTDNEACVDERGTCGWASDEEQLAVGLEPMDGDLCTAGRCLPESAGAGDPA